MSDLLRKVMERERADGTLGVFAAQRPRGEARRLGWLGGP